MSSFRRVVLIAATLLLAGGAVRLGFWQLSRLDERQIRNDLLLAGRAAEPIDLATLEGGWDQIDGRQATSTGRFDPTGELLLRGRVSNKAPGLEVMTPFRLEGSNSAVWVLRGFIPSPDATTPPASFSPGSDGLLTLRGVLFPLPTTDDGGQPLERAGVTTYHRLDRDVAAAQLPGSPPFYLLLEGDADGAGGLPTVPPPPLNDGPHFSYAVQWFGIAIAILAFGVMVLRRADPAHVPPSRGP